MATNFAKVFPLQQLQSLSALGLEPTTTVYTFEEWVVVQRDALYAAGCLLTKYRNEMERDLDKVPPPEPSLREKVVAILEEKGERAQHQLGALSPAELVYLFVFCQEFLEQHSRWAAPEPPLQPLVAQDAPETSKPQPEIKQLEA